MRAELDLLFCREPRFRGARPQEFLAPIPKRGGREGAKVKRPFDLNGQLLPGESFPQQDADPHRHKIRMAQQELKCRNKEIRQSGTPIVHWLRASQ
jgi:hypothetical protein